MAMRPRLNSTAGSHAGFRQRRELAFALLQVSRVQEGFRATEPRRKVIRRHRERGGQLIDGVTRTCKPLQDDRVEVVPVERARRKRLCSQVTLVRRPPLLPGVKDATERARRLSVARMCECVRMRARDGLACRGRIGLERQMRERRLRDRGSAAHQRHDEGSPTTAERKAPPVPSRGYQGRMHVGELRIARAPWNQETNDWAPSVFVEHVVHPEGRGKNRVSQSYSAQSRRRMKFRPVA